MTTPTVALVGTAGFGRRHLEQLLGWHADGLLRLGALVDRDFGAETRERVEAAGAQPRWESTEDLAGVLDGVDLTVVATPPHTHFALARQVLDAGSALYLEKPPVPLLRQLDALRAIDAKRRVEVGFQHARATLEAVAPVIAAGTIGDVSRITAHGCLARPDSYYTRSPWSGQWFVGGEAVFDGVLFNPLAHVVHTALTLARVVDPSWTPTTLEAELYAVHDIAGDDTGVLRVRSQRGPVVVAAGTTATDVVQEPALTIHGSQGHVVVRHRDAAGYVEVAGVRSTLPRPTSVEPLLAAITEVDGPADELVDLDAVRPFVTVVDAAVALVGEPVRVTGVAGPGGPVVPGISGLIDRVVATGSLFGELDVGWARRAGSADLRGYDGLSWPADREGR